MLIETTLALYNKLLTINDDKNISNIAKVGVVTSTNYRELIAKADRENKQIPYPLIVIYDGGNISFDPNRYSYDFVTKKYQTINGIPYSKVFKPMQPYNIPYRVEIVCRVRQQLDLIILWVLKHIHDRDYLEVSYNDDENNKQIYDALVKRGDIINADEGTSSTLYRRTFELSITTLLDDEEFETVPLVVAHKPNYYQIEKG